MSNQYSLTDFNCFCIKVYQLYFEYDYMSATRIRKKKWTKSIANSVIVLQKNTKKHRSSCRLKYLNILMLMLSLVSNWRSTWCTDYYFNIHLTFGIRVGVVKLYTHDASIKLEIEGIEILLKFSNKMFGSMFIIYISNIEYS